MKLLSRSLFSKFPPPTVFSRKRLLVRSGIVPMRSLIFLLVLGVWLVLLGGATARAQATTLRRLSEVATAGATVHSVPGSDGNSYGTTEGGGTYDSGTFFRVTPTGVTTVLYNFTDGADGGQPTDPLIAGSDGNFYGTTSHGGGYGIGTAFQATTAGAVATLFSLGGGGGTSTVTGFIRDSDDHFYGTGDGGGSAMIFKLLSHPAYFDDQASLDGGVYYLTLPDGHYFGYYTFLTDANYLYHFDLGYEYVFDAHDGKSGVYLYDFTSGTFFYTSPSFSFPYLYDFSLNTVLYYYPDPKNAGHYNTDGYRFFYRFDNGQIIVK